VPASRQTTKTPTSPSRGDSRWQDAGAIAGRAFAGSGTALPSDQRAEFEACLGWNFAQVRIHTGPDAAEAADRLGARAFQLGENIAFARGAIAPSTAEGRRLLAHDAAAGWRSGCHWWSKPFTAIAGLLSGAATGLVSGAKTGGKIGSEIGGAVGRFFGPVFGPLIYPATMLLGTIMEFAPVISGGLRLVGRWRIRAGTRDSIGENRGRLPTHSQISKDDPEHPLHNMAARLAVFVDKEIGRAMIAAWAGHKPVSAVQALVDFYIAHPQAHDWWKTLLTAAQRK
jgi:hypothetical protein